MPIVVQAFLEAEWAKLKRPDTVWAKVWLRKSNLVIRSTASPIVFTYPLAQALKQSEQESFPKAIDLLASREPL